MALEKIPNIELNNGTSIPAFGLGTWKSLPNQVSQAVKDAIDLGYRHFDCAFVYENENEVGAAIKEKIEEGVVSREDLFIVSKLWNTFHRPDLVEPAIRKSLENFGLEYLDAYLIHFPMAAQEGDALHPTNDDGILIASDVDYLDTYKEMEKLVDKGLTKSIGVSNFNKAQIERILENCTIPPVINQVECHPYLSQEKLIEYCKSKNIAITAYSPFASPDSPFRKPGDPELLEDLVLKSIANKHEKSVPQICLRWIIQKGLIVIPKSVTKSRIAENMQVFGFELEEEDMVNINCLNRDWRAVNAKIMGEDHKYYPFNDEF
ncbi:unnamed protein product [Orchesella dallaii]|uniref:NADP-dependent oxidoreductase domain-containing protein n=1 Tax=Orchesella dallaii TaxID=48710 RepID=A0ABP1PQT7_9HEXA